MRKKIKNNNNNIVRFWRFFSFFFFQLRFSSPQEFWQLTQIFCISSLLHVIHYFLLFYLKFYEKHPSLPFWSKKNSRWCADTHREKYILFVRKSFGVLFLSFDFELFNVWRFKKFHGAHALIYFLQFL